MSERNASSQRDQNQDRSLILDYSGLRRPLTLRRFAGKLSLYAAVVQVIWVVLLLPIGVFISVFIWKTPPPAQWLWLCFIAWPSVVALVFGVYSLRVSGFNRTNVPGVIGLIFSGIVVSVMVTLFVLGP